VFKNEQSAATAGGHLEDELLNSLVFNGIGFGIWNAISITVPTVLCLSRSLTAEN
jgi:hypothetical protein